MKNKCFAILIRTVPLLLVVGAFNLSCSTNSKKAIENPPLPASQDCTVYLAVIDERLGASRTFTKPRLIKKQTFTFDYLLPMLGDNYLAESTPKDRVKMFRDELKLASEETLEDFEKIYHESSDISRECKFSEEYKFINDDAKHEDVKKLNSSGRYVQFSKVGYNKAGNEAILQINYVCPVLCGFGEFLLMEKRDGNWKIKSQMKIWVS